MGVLRGIHLHGPVVVGKGRVPMGADRGGLRLTQQMALAGWAARGKGVQAGVWKVGVAHEGLASGIWKRMPCGKVADPPPGTGVHMDGLHAPRPVDKGQLQGAGNPAFMGDPLLVALALVQALMAAPIDAANPQAIGHRPGIKNELGVIWAKLRMPDDGVVKSLVRGLLLQVDEQHVGAPTVAHWDGPGPVVTRQGGGAHGRTHHAFDLVGLLLKSHQHLFLQGLHVEPMGTALGGEQQVAAIVRGVQ